MNNSTVAPSEIASSVAQSVKSQLNIKLETNKIKADLKALLKNVDQGKTLTLYSTILTLTCR